MASFVITSYTNSFTIAKDGHVKEFQKGTLGVDTDPNHPSYIDINTTLNREELYRIDLDKDTLDVDGTTSWADSTEVQTALRTFFFRDVNGGGGGSFVSAQNVYIDPNGDDGTAVVGDANKPFQTIFQAFQSANPGDTLVINPGVYNNTSNLATKSINISAPNGLVDIYSGLTTNVLYDSAGAVNFSMKGQIRWFSQKGPIDAPGSGSNYGQPVWQFTNPATKIDIDVLHCDFFRIKIQNNNGGNIKINTSYYLGIEIAGSTNVNFLLGDMTQFSWVDSVTIPTPNVGIKVKALGGRAKMTKDNTFNLGQTTNRHKSTIYQDNWQSGVTDNPTFLSSVIFQGFDIDSPRNTVQAFGHMNYTFIDCKIETSRASGGGDAFINIGGQTLGKKMSIIDCRFKSLTSGGIGYKTQNDPNNGLGLCRFLGINVFQCVTSDSLQAILANSEIDLIGTIITNTNVATNGLTLTNKISGTNILIDSDVTV